MSTKKYLLLLLGTLLLIPFTGKSQENNDPVFALNITLTHTHKKLGDYVIYLKHKDLADDTVTVRKGKEVYVTLMRNEVYTFTFHKKGFRDRTMVLNTSLPETVKASELFTLSFPIEMMPEEVIDEQKTETAPTAYAVYDSKDDDFNLEDAHQK
jgi:hypothetical protein